MHNKLKTFDMNFKEIYDKIDKQAKEHAFAVAGSNVMISPCGFASIRFPRKAYRTDPFVKWLLAEGIASNSSIEKCYYIWVGHGFNQSVSHKYAYAEKFVELVKEHVENQSVYAWERLD